MEPACFFSLGYGAAKVEVEVHRKVLLLLYLRGGFLVLFMLETNCFTGKYSFLYLLILQILLGKRGQWCC